MNYTADGKANGQKQIRKSAWKHQEKKEFKLLH